jgi:hypothetical protein
VQAFLVIVDGYAEAVFGDRSEALAYTEQLGQPAQIQVLSYWAPGTWLYGTSLRSGHTRPTSHHDRLTAAYLKHQRLNRRCVGMTVQTEHTATGDRFRCGNCGDLL